MTASAQAVGDEDVLMLDISKSCSADNGGVFKVTGEDKGDDARCESGGLRTEPEGCMGESRSELEGAVCPC
jgi:hypothetical protein